MPSPRRTILLTAAPSRILIMLLQTLRINSQCDPCIGTSASTFKVMPGTNCKEYVQCSAGQKIGDLECQGDTVFDEGAQYCNWPDSVTCVDAPCPTVSPISAEEAGPVESDNCPNPCQPGFSGFQTRPGTGCSKYVQCLDGEVTDELSCTGDNIFKQSGGYCDWPGGSTCDPVVCPEQLGTAAPTVAPSNVTSINYVEGDDSASTVDNTADDSCTNPCPLDYVGFQTVPNTECKKYVQCDSGSAVWEFECPDGGIFIQDDGNCRMVSTDESQSNGTDVDELWAVDNGACAPVPCPGSADETSHSDTAKPTPTPATAYQNVQKFLFQRQGMIRNVVLRSQNGPSSEYTFDDMLTALDTMEFKLPRPVSFFLGENNQLKGLNYGLVNLAAFLANAMVEGIRIDSCEEWNTDDIDGTGWKYPLSNSCGMNTREYTREVCREDVNYQCPTDNTMEITATSKPGENWIEKGKAGPPPLSCAPSDGGYPGYYDALTDTVVQAAFANTRGRVDTEGCCWWGRGALLTRGRCILGKLNKYLGKGALDEGYSAPFRYINFCSTPNAICDSYSTRELRWILGFFEWSEVIQPYNNIGDGWNYYDKLKEFVDGGMRDDKFFLSTINILTRKCNDGLCQNIEIPFEEERKANFRRIIDEVFELPLKGNFQVTDYPTPQPTSFPTQQPTKKEKKKVQIVELPSSAYARRLSLVACIASIASAVSVWALFL
eukprot:g4370.t1 g4370   contig15:888758-891022(-)